MISFLQEYNKVFKNYIHTFFKIEQFNCEYYLNGLCKENIVENNAPFVD